MLLSNSTILLQPFPPHASVLSWSSLSSQQSKRMLPWSHSEVQYWQRTTQVYRLQGSLAAATVPALSVTANMVLLAYIAGVQWARPCNLLLSCQLLSLPMNAAGGSCHNWSIQPGWVLFMPCVHQHAACQRVFPNCINIHNEDGRCASQMGVGICGCPLTRWACISFINFELVQLVG